MFVLLRVNPGSRIECGMTQEKHAMQCKLIFKFNDK